jgi:hypothetical protein
MGVTQMAASVDPTTDGNTDASTQSDSFGDAIDAAKEINEIKMQGSVEAIAVAKEVAIGNAATKPLDKAAQA